MQTVQGRLEMREARFGLATTPIDDVLIAVSDDGLCDIGYLSYKDRQTVLQEIERRGFVPREDEPAVLPVRDQLREYFNRERTEFTLPLDLTGITAFTRDVLLAICAIPYGSVWTYGELAKVIGKPGASRAVGNALGRNPVPIVIPCHRVIRSNGDMGWYTGGPHIKAALLDVEGVRLEPSRESTSQLAFPLSS